MEAWFPFSDRVIAEKLIEEGYRAKSLESLRRVVNNDKRALMDEWSARSTVPETVAAMERERCLAHLAAIERAALSEFSKENASARSVTTFANGDMMMVETVKERGGVRAKYLELAAKVSQARATMIAATTVKSDEENRDGLNDSARVATVIDMSFLKDVEDELERRRYLELALSNHRSHGVAYEVGHGATVTADGLRQILEGRPVSDTNRVEAGFRIVQTGRTLNEMISVNLRAARESEEP